MSNLSHALISVSDKTGIVELAQALVQQNITILSTGGTAKLLQQHQIPVMEVSDYTGFPEIMGGRVKTLHPKIHGGILGRRNQDQAVMQQHDIPAIDLVIVNLYPFEATVQNPDCDLATAIENIDIGGPTLLRAAAKNHADVTVVVNPNDYDELVQAIKNNSLDQDKRFELARKAFAHTAYYDGVICNYLYRLNPKENFEKQAFADVYCQQFQKIQDLRYGENPHQQAVFYKDSQPTLNIGVAAAKQHQGKALSYNNIADTDAALECVKSFEQPTCVIVKHANPCGVAVADDLLTAYQKAFQTDPTSAFGGIIAFNRSLDASTAEAIISQQFVEVIIAPEINADAETVLATKANVRVLSTGQWQKPQAEFDFKRITGGLLVQDKDIKTLTQTELEVVTTKQPTEQEWQDLLFAWKVAKFVKSNAIVYCRELQTIGVGAGQMSRVYSAKIAGIKAQDENFTVAGSVMASDAFFPFRDGIDSAANVGITAVIQPGGSMRDQEVIDAANEHGMSMVFTKVRHFRH